MRLRRISGREKTVKGEDPCLCSRQRCTAASEPLDARSASGMTRVSRCFLVPQFESQIPPSHCCPRLHTRNGYDRRAAQIPAGSLLTLMRIKRDLPIALSRDLVFLLTPSSSHGLLPVSDAVHLVATERGMMKSQGKHSVAGKVSQVLELSSDFDVWERKLVRWNSNSGLLKLKDSLKILFCDLKFLVKVDSSS